MKVVPKGALAAAGWRWRRKVEFKTYNEVMARVFLVDGPHVATAIEAQHCLPPGQEAPRDTDVTFCLLDVGVSV